MYVNSISFLNAHFDSNTARHHATIHLVIDQNNVTLCCTVDLIENAPVKEVIAGILNDAKRQIMRMPEYRSGAQILHFAPDSEAQLLATAA